MKTKTDFMIVFLMENVYPVLMLRVWYQQIKPCTPTNVLDDTMQGRIDGIICDALVESLRIEENLRILRKSNPGVLILFMN